MAARVLHEPGTCLQVDQFEWRHPVLNLHVLGTIMVDAGSRAASVTIHRVIDVEHGLGNVRNSIPSAVAEQNHNACSNQLCGSKELLNHLMSGIWCNVPLQPCDTDLPRLHREFVHLVMAADTHHQPLTPLPTHRTQGDL